MAGKFECLLLSLLLLVSLLFLNQIVMDAHSRWVLVLNLSMRKDCENGLIMTRALLYGTLHVSTYGNTTNLRVPIEEV